MMNEEVNIYVWTLQLNITIVNRVCKKGKLNAACSYPFHEITLINNMA